MFSRSVNLREVVRCISLPAKGYGGMATSLEEHNGPSSASRRCQPLADATVSEYSISAHGGKARASLKHFSRLEDLPFLWQHAARQLASYAYTSLNGCGLYWAEVWAADDLVFKSNKITPVRAVVSSGEWSITTDGAMTSCGNLQLSSDLEPPPPLARLRIEGPLNVPLKGAKVKIPFLHTTVYRQRLTSTRKSAPMEWSDFRNQLVAACESTKEDLESIPSACSSAVAFYKGISCLLTTLQWSGGSSVSMPNAMRQRGSWSIQDDPTAQILPGLTLKQPPFPRV